MPRLGESEAIVPVGPRPRCELSDFSLREHPAQAGLSGQRDQELQIIVIPDVHHLRDEGKKTGTFYISKQREIVGMR